MKRRTFMQLFAAATATPLLGCSSADPVFPQGVASSDPSPEGVLLWTRVEATSSERVTWEVASDADFKSIVASGEVMTTAETDHAISVEVEGLGASAYYWYRFHARGSTSRIGRTRTAPAPGEDAPVRFALASCQDYGGRWFHAWRALADRDDVDFVLFIGDYIYETIGHAGIELGERDIALPDGLLLEDPVKGKIAALTLADYRTLYRTYRLDPDLQDVHARFPFISLWDDHEFANDCWGDHATDFDDYHGDEASPERYEAATRAWREYHPIRRPNAPDIYRSLRWGKHAEFVLIDERCHRDDHLIPEGPIDAEVGHIQMNSAFGSRTFVIKSAFDTREAAAQPSMVGVPQRDWAIATLRASTATWKLLASPLVLAQMVIDLSAYAQLPDQFRQRYYFKTDQWDGFRSERRNILEACAQIDNLVALSGDLHGFYAADLHADFDAPATPLAVEYVTSAISAPTIDMQLAAVIDSNLLLESLGLRELIPEFDTNLLATNPHIRHADSIRNGFAVVEVRADAVDVRFVMVSDVTKPDGRVIEERAFTTPLGSKAVIAKNLDA
jgi:alkaline phosphatase D